MLRPASSLMQQGHTAVSLPSLSRPNTCTYMVMVWPNRAWDSLSLTRLATTDNREFPRLIAYRAALRCLQSSSPIRTWMTNSTSSANLQIWPVISYQLPLSHFIAWLPWHNNPSLQVFTPFSQNTETSFTRRRIEGATREANPYPNSGRIQGERVVRY